MVELPKTHRQRDGQSTVRAAGPGPDLGVEQGSVRGTKRGGCLGVLSLVVGVLYILNPTGGFIELLPDNLPILGNLDEAGATALVLLGLRLLGVDPFRFSERKRNSGS